MESLWIQSLWINQDRKHEETASSVGSERRGDHGLCLLELGGVWGEGSCSSVALKQRRDEREAPGSFGELAYQETRVC